MNCVCRHRQLNRLAVLFSVWKLPFSVKGFFVWLLLSALLLQPPRFISDVFSFEWCAMCRSEIPLARRVALFEECISLSNAEGLLPAEKEVWHLDRNFPLVLTYKGKTKGKYIRLRHKTGETP